MAEVAREKVESQTQPGGSHLRVCDLGARTDNVLALPGLNPAGFNVRIMPVQSQYIDEDVFRVDVNRIPLLEPRDAVGIRADAFAFGKLLFHRADGDEFDYSLPVLWGKVQRQWEWR